MVDPSRLHPTALPAPAPLRETWRAHGLVGDGRIGWVLERAAAARPEATALATATERWTFADMLHWSRAIAAQLTERGIGSGDVVLFALDNSAVTIATAAAIWRIGAVANPVVPLYRQREFAFIVAQLRPAAIVTSSDLRGRNLCAEIDEACARVGHEPARLSVGRHAGWDPLHSAPPTHADAPRAMPAPPDEPCLVLYTSGTTSDPKGVLHTSQTLLQEVASMQRAWGLTFRDVMLMASPLTHITGLLQGLLVPCQVGARAVLLDRWDPGACVDIAEAEGATYMAGATPFLRGILDVYDERGTRPSTLHQFCCGGAAVPPELIRRADRLGIAAYRCWGLTELPTATLASERDDLEHRATTDGRVAEGVEVEAVDAEHRPQGPGVEGELRVRGPEQMVGYVDASLNAAAVDADGWLYTGDLGTVEDDYVRITGRIKDVINRGGEKLSAREIESLLELHPSVSEVAVVPLPDERLGELVCAVVVVEADAVLDEYALRSYMREQDLAVQKIPARFAQVDALPRTASGKVRKHELVDRFSGSA